LIEMAICRRRGVRQHRSSLTLMNNLDEKRL
jgi:hypothetical protein